MSLADFNIKMKADTSDLDAKLPTYQRRLQEINKGIYETEYNLARVARRGILVVGSTARTLEALAHLFPGMINPAFQAIYDAIFATVSSLTSIAAAYTAGGITAPFAVIVESAAIALNVYGAALALSGQQDAAREIQRMQMEVRNLGVQVTTMNTSLSAIGAEFS